MGGGALAEVGDDVVLFAGMPPDERFGEFMLCDASLPDAAAAAAAAIAATCIWLRRNI